MSLTHDDFTSPKLVDTSHLWTYDEYAALPDNGNRYEVINGALIMSPSPTSRHQMISKWLLFHLTTYVDLAGIGTVVSAPLDVVLPTGDIIQPDLLVVLNTGQAFIDDKKIIGPPDLVIEIASPGTVLVDRTSKYSSYQSAGVIEYWMVKPESKTIEVYVLKEEKYELIGTFSGTSTIPSSIVPDIAQIQVSQFFA